MVTVEGGKTTLKCDICSAELVFLTDDAWLAARDAERSGWGWMKDRRLGGLYPRLCCPECAVPGATFNRPPDNPQKR